jgi:glutaminyl-tRNA synthetase
VEPSLAGLAIDHHVQFERHGYFVTDRKTHETAAPVFNRVTTLRDGWAR